MRMVPGGFDAVLSDMCHNTMGCGDADAARSTDLGKIAASISCGGKRLRQLKYRSFTPPFIHSSIHSIIHFFASML